MLTSFERNVELERLIREECKIYPHINPNWVVDRWIGDMQANAREDAKIIALMMPEIIRSSIREIK
jgi:K+/H+ antiporter YhaU regulatory subunit KhtT